MENGLIFKAINDFFTTNEGELCLKKGDIVQVLEKIDRHWCYGCYGDKYGNIPSNYLISVDPPLLADTQELFAAVADFSGQQSGDLTFQRGELIVGLNQVNSNWWSGKIGDRLGIFPTTYVWQLDSKYLKKTSQNKLVNMEARVKLNLKAQLEEEMDLFEGEIITITEIIDKNWYRGFYGSRNGIFPSAYVEVIDSTIPCTSQTKKINQEGNNTFSTLAKEEAPQHTLENSESEIDEIFDDNYFRINMPSIFKHNSCEKSENKVLELHSQPTSLDVVPYGITLYPFYAQFDNELSFHEGEIINLIRHIDKHWIEGKIDEKKGIFPANYVNILVDCQADVMHSETAFNVQEKILNNTLPNVKPNSQAKVLYNFDAQMNCDISVKENDIVCIIEVVNEDWYKVQNEIGEIGLCPRAYLCLESDKESGLEPLYIDKSYNSKNVLDMQSEYFREANTDIEDQNNDSLFCPTIQLDSHNHTDKCLENSSVAISPLIDLGEELLKDELGIDLVQNNEIERNSNQYIFFGQPDLKDELQSKNLDIINTMKESLHEDGVDLREKKIQQTLKGHEELSRVVSVDRIPHRPAPPIPLPGQQPVRRHLHRPSPTVSGLNKEEFLSSVETEANPIDIFQQEEQRLKNIEQRQNVISELVYTEKEYVRDLKITYETFNLHNPTFLERRGIDVQIVFGNLLEVLNLAEDFLDLLQLAMKGKSEEDQCVGSCFLQVADKMKLVYGLYCMNHDNALTLFEKYESNPDIKAAFDKGLETLRYQIVCFDMSSILIKPVQRILKYPLIINELIKCTEDNHKDKQDLLNAVITMMEVASYINEYKRRNDIVTKYLDIDDTISNRMSKISLHSVAKKSTRIGVMLSSSLGIKSATKDLDFDEQEVIFHSMDKMIRSFLKTVEMFVASLEDIITLQQSMAEAISVLYNEKIIEVDRYQSIHNRIYSHFWMDFKSSVERRVMDPLNTLLAYFDGPEKLVQKRNDKLLDYDGYCARADKLKDNRQFQEELAISKSNYEALNWQLLEELPILTTLACELFVECMAAFVTSRRLLSGKITKQYLTLMELPLMKTSQGDLLETYILKHTLIWSHLGRYTFSPKVVKMDSTLKRNSKSPVQNLGQDNANFTKEVNQSYSQRAYLHSRYTSDILYRIKYDYNSKNQLEVSVKSGDLIAVIKKQNPMGDPNVWFVDNGETQGFLPIFCLMPEIDTQPIEIQPCISSLHETKLSIPTVLVPQHQHPSRPSSLSALELSPNSNETSPVQRVSGQLPSYEEVVLADISEDSKEDDSNHIYEEIPDNVEYFYALYNFVGNGEYMLTVQAGQVVKVLHKEDFEGNPEWWLVENHVGSKGYVPANYLSKYTS
uniref:Dynamin-binding protein n=1 Tax=Timema cristinae TaxID=61476 RepID=A0A7R9CHB5_TIMCR|nr:unnamed protein product [Timema cristinae]